MCRETDQSFPDERTDTTRKAHRRCGRQNTGSQVAVLLSQQVFELPDACGSTPSLGPTDTGSTPATPPPRSVVPHPLHAHTAPLQCGSVGARL